MLIVRSAIAAGALLLLTGAGPALDTQAGRFVMSPADGGVLRLDTQTGAMSMCRQANGQWGCQTLPDDRQAFESEIDRLSRENRELKESVKRLEDARFSSAEPKPTPKMTLPTEEDVDRAMDYMQRMYRKFRDKLRELETETDRKGTNL